MEECANNELGDISFQPKDETETVQIENITITSEPNEHSHQPSCEIFENVEHDDDDGELDYEPSEPENSLKDAMSSDEESGQVSPPYAISKIEPDARVVHENGINEKTSDISSDEVDVEQDEVPNQWNLKAYQVETELEDGEVEDSDGDQVPSPLRPPQHVNYDPKQRPVEPVRSSIVYSPTKSQEAVKSAPAVNVEELVKADEIGVCKFFLRGQCTWANFCKFSHPGFNDNNKALVEQTPKIQPISQYPPPESIPIATETSHDRSSRRSALQLEAVSSPVDALRRLLLPPPPAPPTLAAGGAAQAVSAWERGVKQARELMRKAERRENDILAPDDDENKNDDDYVRNKTRMHLDFKDDAVEEAIDARRNYSIDDKRSGPPQQKRYIASHLKKKIEELAAAVQESPGERALPYYRPSYKNNEWKDPWMRSAATADAEKVASVRLSSSPQSRRRRSRSSSSSLPSASTRSSYSTSSGNGSSRSRRRRRPSSSTSRSRSGDKRRSKSASSSAVAAKLSTHSVSPKSGSASSGSTGRAKRRNARNRISHKIKRMNIGQENSRFSQNDAEHSRSQSSVSEGSVDLNELDQKQASLGFDIKHLITKKITAAHDHIPRKPIKMKIVSKSRVQLPASYSVVDNMGGNDNDPSNITNGKRALSPLSPSDLPSDTESKRGRWATDELQLEDISSEPSESDDNDDVAFEQLSNDGESPASDDDAASAASGGDGQRLAAEASDISSADSDSLPPTSPLAQQLPTTATSPTVAPPSTTVNCRREELLRQLRAVEDAIAKKRSTKAATNGNQNTCVVAQV